MLKRLSCFSLVALCLALRPPAFADDTPDKLRDLVRLPGMTSSFYLGYDSLSGYNIQTDADTSKDTPDSLRKTLHGDAEDAIIYSRIGNLYIADGKPTDAFAAYAKSAGLFQAQVNTAPREAAKWARLALALHQTELNTERDKAMAQAIALAPNDPQVWDARAQIEFADSLAALSGQAENLRNAQVPLRLLHLLKQAQPKEKLNAALSLLNQAKADYEKAVAVAPDDWHGYMMRWLMRPTYEMDTGLFNEALQNRPVTEEEETRRTTEYYRSIMASDGLNDMVTAARVSHEQPLALGMAAYFVVLQEGLRKPDNFDLMHGGLMKRLPEADQKTERDLMARMEALTHSTNHTIAGQSALVLGVNQMLLLTPAEGRVSLLLAQTLLPNDPNLIELLTSAYVSDEKFADIQSLIKDALQHHESVRWRLFLAKAEVKQSHWDDAERDVNVALQNEPKNLDANLAQCAILLHRAKEDTGLREAAAQLTRTHELFGSTFTADQKFSFNYLGGILYALVGNPAEARNYLKDAQGTGDQNADVKSVLALLP